MKISTKGRYALRMMLDLADHQQDGFVALKDIAARQNISKKYLEQIVPILNKSNFCRLTAAFRAVIVWLMHRVSILSAAFCALQKATLHR